MAANVLNSPQATQMSVFVIRAFVKMRSLLTDTRELAQKLAAIETELKSRPDSHETAIVDVLHRIMRLVDPPPADRAGVVAGLQAEGTAGAIAVAGVVADGILKSDAS
jgi:hypothetical protein